jgi:hypothetical protein
VIELHIRVAGVTFEGRQGVLAWMAGSPEWFGGWGSIHLEPEPDNEYDPDAIKVLAVYPGGETQCGYIPRGRTAQVHALARNGPVQVRVKRVALAEDLPDSEAPGGTKDVWFLEIAVRGEEGGGEQYT